MTKYRYKAMDTTAFQFTGNMDCYHREESQWLNDSLLFDRIEATTDLRTNEVTFAIVGLSGKQRLLHCGDWVYRDGYGGLQCVSDKKFREMYTPLTEDEADNGDGAEGVNTEDEKSVCHNDELCALRSDIQDLLDTVNNKDKWVHLSFAEQSFFINSLKEKYEAVSAIFKDKPILNIEWNKTR